MLLWERLIVPANGDTKEALPTDRDIIRIHRLPYDKRCSAITKYGHRCRGRIRRGKEVCPFHDPSVSAERRRRIAAKGGRSHHRLSRLPDGYLRRLSSRRGVGEAMDRLYRELRLGLVTPEMASVLFNILTRMLDSGLCDSGVGRVRSSGRSRADRLRPKLGRMLTRAERAAWREAVANAPATFLRTGSQQENPTSGPGGRDIRKRTQTTDGASAPAALSAAS